LRDAAADMVMQEIGTNNALGIKKEDVKSLLNQMDQQTDTTGRRNVVESWLNDRAERENINFSAVLQEALKEKLQLA